jgi:hypothetical protein
MYIMARFSLDEDRVSSRPVTPKKSGSSLTTAKPGVHCQSPASAVESFLKTMEA